MSTSSTSTTTSNTNVTSPEVSESSTKGTPRKKFQPNKIEKITTISLIIFYFSGDGNNVGIVVGASVGGAGGISIVVAFVIIIRVRLCKKKKSNTEQIEMLKSFEQNSSCNKKFLGLFVLIHI